MKTQTTAPSIGGTSRGRLKAARHFVLPAVLLLGFAALAPTSNAQANLIRIRNVGNEFVKVCVYEGHDRVQLIPLRCWDLSASEAATWNRTKLTVKPGITKQRFTL